MTMLWSLSWVKTQLVVEKAHENMTGGETACENMTGGEIACENMTGGETARENMSGGETARGKTTAPGTLVDCFAQAHDVNVFQAKLLQLQFARTRRSFLRSTINLTPPSWRPMYVNNTM